MARRLGDDAGVSCGSLVEEGLAGQEKDDPGRGNCSLRREEELVFQAEFCAELEVVLLTDKEEGGSLDLCSALRSMEDNCVRALLTE